MLRRTTQRWHSLLGMQRYDRSWHRKDIAGEIQELREVLQARQSERKSTRRNRASLKFPLRWLSEVSDCVYTRTRALHAGHDIASPFRSSKQYPGLPSLPLLLGTAYMIPKYSLRFLFYRAAVRLLRIEHQHSLPGDQAPLWLLLVPSPALHSAVSLLATEPAPVPKQRSSTVEDNLLRCDIREVRNPDKRHKLAEIAAKNGLDAERFCAACARLRPWWVLLP